MDDLIDVTKIPSYRAEWSYKEKDLSHTIIPRRHICGEIVQANITGEDVIFYSRFDTGGKGRPISNCPLCGHLLAMDWMRALYLVEPMTWITVLHTEGRKVCSNCWGWNYERRKIGHCEGQLEQYYYLLCADCKEETIGYVTQKYVGYAREKDRVDYGRALNGLIESLELEQPGIPVDVKNVKQPRTREQNLAELGF